jgi:tRNA(adenine34) deaminase
MMEKSASIGRASASHGSKALDTALMQRCIALAMKAADRGEYPYAAIVCCAGEIVCESMNSVRQDRDASHHAELVAITEAYRRLNRISLEDCTLYANAEPCALCSYAIRESRIGRVVYGLPAPLTGGMSRWHILDDGELSKRLPEVFAPPPEIVAGFMAEEIEAAIASRYPIAWEFIRARNMFGGPLPSHIIQAPEMARNKGLRDRLMSLLRRRFFDYFGRK